MDPLDRFQALLRHPDYHRNVPPSLIRRLKTGLHPFLLTDLLQRTRIPLAQKIRAIQLLEAWGIHHTVDPESKDQCVQQITKLKARKGTLFKDDLRVRIAEGRLLDTPSDQGCFLTVTLDLRTPSSRLVALLLSVIARERKARRVRIKKRVEQEVDPWTVWDMMQIPGNTLLKITRQLFRVRGNPAYHDSRDNPIAASYKKVDRAYRKAKSMIKEVGDRRSNRLPYDTAVARSVVEFSLACTNLLKDFIATHPDYKVPKMDPNRVIDLFPTLKPFQRTAPPPTGKDA